MVTHERFDEFLRTKGDEFSLEEALRLLGPEWKKVDVTMMVKCRGGRQLRRGVYHMDGRGGPDIYEEAKKFAKGPGTYCTRDFAEHCVSAEVVEDFSKITSNINYTRCFAVLMYERGADIGYRGNAMFYTTAL